jgi:hypothetical protein
MPGNNVDGSGAAPEDAPDRARHLEAGDLHELGDVDTQLHGGGVEARGVLGCEGTEAALQR